jgi:ankyrin repeat/SOCS box protein 10
VTAGDGAAPCVRALLAGGAAATVADGSGKSCCSNCRAFNPMCTGCNSVHPGCNPMHPGKSALHVAAAHGAAECAAVLLRGGADAAAAASGGLQPLHLAAASDHLAVVDTLLAGGAPCDALGGAELAPLHLAAGSGALRALSRLLEAGHPQLQPHALAAATLCPQRLQPLVSRLQPHFCIQAGALLERPAGTSGRTALHLACHHGRTAAVQLLLSAGADARAADAHGSTPLHWACKVPQHTGRALPTW